MLCEKTNLNIILATHTGDLFLTKPKKAYEVNNALSTVYLFIAYVWVPLIQKLSNVKDYEEFWSETFLTCK